MTPPKSKIYSAAPCPELSMFIFFMVFIFSPLVLLILSIIYKVILFLKKVILKKHIFINIRVDKFNNITYKLLDDGENVGKIGKLISGIILLIIGIGIAYIAYTNNLIDLILVLGGVISIIGIVLIITYAIDSSADKTRTFLTDHINKSNISFSDFTGSQEDSQTQSGPLKVRREFDNFDEEEFYNDDNYIYVEHDNDEYIENDPSTVLQPRNNDNTYGNNLDFEPNYKKPIKITRQPKRRDRSYFDDEPYVYGGVEDKSESIRQALQEGTPQQNLKSPSQKPHRDIKIDVNDPDSLPIPKLLNSFVIYGHDIITTEEAFAKLATEIKKEVMLEIPSLNDLSDRFLSYIPTIYSRVIIEEFDVSNMAYMILVASLLKQGVEIRTMPKVNTINLLTDDSYGLILSNGRGGNDMEYGAIYTDINAISEIRGTFDKAWKLAHELDRETILNYTKQEGY